MGSEINPAIGIVLLALISLFSFSIFTSCVREDIIEDTTTKADVKIEESSRCGFIEIGLQGVCVDTKLMASRIELKVDVEGDDPVGGLYVKIFNDKNEVGYVDYNAEEPVEFPTRVVNKELVIKNSAGYPMSLENPVKVEVYPKTGSLKICKNKMKMSEVIDTCK